MQKMKQRRYKLPLVLLAVLVLLAALCACDHGPEEETEPTAASTAASPTEAPTAAPTEAPTEAPTAAPTDAPSEAPTDAPTAEPTAAPTEAPTDAPTAAPTEAPTETPTEPNIPDVPDDPKAHIVSGIDDQGLVGTWVYSVDAVDLLGMSVASWGGSPRDLDGLSMRMYLDLHADGTAVLLTTPSELETFATTVAGVILPEGTPEAQRSRTVEEIRAACAGAYFTYAVRAGKIYVSLSMDTVYDTDAYSYDLSVNKLYLTDLTTSYFPDPFDGALSVPLTLSRTTLPAVVVDPENIGGNHPVDVTDPSDPLLIGTWTKQMDYTDVLRAECAASDVTLEYSEQLLAELVYVFGPDGRFEIFVEPENRDEFRQKYVDATVAVTVAFLGESGGTYEDYLVHIGMTDEEYREYNADEVRRLLAPKESRYYAKDGKIWIDYNEEFVGEAGEYTKYAVSGDTLTFTGFHTDYEDFFTGFVPFYPFDMTRPEPVG